MSKHETLYEDKLVVAGDLNVETARSTVDVRSLSEMVRYLSNLLS